MAAFSFDPPLVWIPKIRLGYIRSTLLYIYFGEHFVAPCEEDIIVSLLPQSGFIQITHPTVCPDDYDSSFTFTPACTVVSCFQAAVYFNSALHKMAGWLFTSHFLDLLANSLLTFMSQYLFIITLEYHTCVLRSQAYHLSTIQADVGLFFLVPSASFRGLGISVFN